jgi:hypothetical protein
MAKAAVRSFLFIILMLKLCYPVRRIVLSQSSPGISSSSRQKSNTPLRSWISLNDGDLQGKNMKLKWSSINDVTQFKVSHIYEVILYTKQNYKLCSTPNNNLWYKIFGIYEESSINDVTKYLTIFDTPGPFAEKYLILFLP